MPSSALASSLTSASRSRDIFRGPFFSSPFALAFVFSLAFYTFLLPPSIVRGGDCGELIAASYTLGIAHPSGYPIWCLLGRIFAFLPWGEVAARLNFFSALCASLAVATIAATVQLLIGESNSRAKWAAVGAGFLLGGFFFFGSQALLAEVYALAALEGALLLFFAVRWKQKRDWRDLYTFAWLAGLSPFVHLSGVFLWPILGIWALWGQKNSISRILILAALWASGLLFALYLPIRSAHFPAPPLASLDAYFYFPLDWGHPASGFTALKNHLSAAQYSGLLKPRPLGDLLENLASLGQFVLFGFLWATPLFLWGALSAFRRGLGVVLLAIFVLNVAVQIQYDVGDQSNFFFPAYLVMGIWMGLGWFEFLNWLEKRAQKFASPSLWPWRLRTLGTISLLATIGAQWFLFGATSNGKGVFRIRDGALETARAAQALAQRDGKTVAALFVHDDTLWPFWYAKYVLGEARDVETPWGRGLKRVRNGGKMSDYVAQLKKNGPIVLAQWDSGTDARFPLVMLTPSGNLCEASDRALPPTATAVAAPQNPLENAPNGLLAARFRRADLWRGQSEVSEISPASLAAFEVDFRVAQLQNNAKIEVLIAQKGFFGSQKPIPSQSTVSVGSGDTGHVFVSRQSRRLILSPDAKNGQILRAAVPLQIEATSPVGRYEVWARIVSPEDKDVAWTRSDEIHLTVK
jgi:hypothetical protein